MATTKCTGLMLSREATWVCFFVLLKARCS